MASIRGILNIQSLNELTSENLLLVICKPCVSKSSEHSKTHKPGTANAANPSAKTQTTPVTVVSTLRRRLTLPFALLAYESRLLFVLRCVSV